MQTTPKLLLMSFLLLGFCSAALPSDEGAKDEMTHGSREIFQLKDRLLRFLIQVVVFEACMAGTRERPRSERILRR